MPEKKPASKKPVEDEKETYYVCPYCERGFKSKNALNGHLGVCKARPDVKEPDEEEEEEEDIYEGIKLFKEEDEEEDDVPKSGRREVEDEDDDGYQCGGCGYTSRREFRYCPKCGEENDFS